MSLRRTTTAVFAAAAAVVLVGCGDAETSDPRPYTKAPLENLGVTIESENRTLMDRLGVPDRPGLDTEEPAEEETETEGEAEG